MNNIIAKLENIIKDIANNNEPGHDYNHILRVRNLAKNIANNYECDSYLVDILALVHDVEDIKLHSSLKVSDLLTNLNLEQNYIEKIINIVPYMSFSKHKIVDTLPLEAKIVIDADRIDALGAIGVARAFSYGGSHNRSFEQTIKHFDDKLLILGEYLYLDVSKKIAEERIKFIRDFYNEFNKENKA